MTSEMLKQTSLALRHSPTADAGATLDAQAVVVGKTFQRDAQYDLGRTCRPAIETLGFLETAQMATDIEQQIVQTRTSRTHGGGEALLGGEHHVGQRRFCSLAAGIADQGLR